MSDTPLDNEGGIDLEKIEVKIKANKGKIVIALIIAILFALGSLIYYGEEAFIITIKYNSLDGNYSCTEKFKFGNNLTALCEVPEQYTFPAVDYIDYNFTLEKMS